MRTDIAPPHAPTGLARRRVDAPAQPAAAPSGSPATPLRTRAERVVQRFAPVWPLDAFVAVNTFMGHADRPFEAAVAHLARVQGVRALPARDTWREAWRSGVIVQDDLRSGPDVSMHEMLAALDGPPAPVDAGIPTVAQVLDALPGREGPWSTLLVDEIGKTCAAWFDRGQAAWPVAAEGASLFETWRAVAAIDRTPAVHGLAGFGEAVSRLPADPVTTIGAVLDRLGWPDAQVEDYLERALTDIAGWAAAARHRAWTAGLAGGTDDSALQLLAVRVAWDGLLFELRRDALRDAWPEAVARAAQPMPEASTQSLAIDLAWQAAYERAARRRLGARLRSHDARDAATAAMSSPPANAVPVTVGNNDNDVNDDNRIRDTHGSAPAPAPAPATAPTRAPSAPAAAGIRPAVHAVFCIDVRSEVLRRHLEAAWPAVRTQGFAGFFGLPISLVGTPERDTQARCPALLAPTLDVETGPDDPQRAQAEDRDSRTRAAWQRFRALAVAGFAQVEALGWASAFGLARARLAGLNSGRADPADAPAATGRYQRLRPRLGPAARVDAAAALLGALQMGAGCAPLVVLVGHDAAVTNNPHAASLACGACGGRGGEINARVAAGLLNDPAVRVGLKARGHEVPDDTWFLAAVHDTPTDTIALIEVDAAPPAHAEAIDRLRESLSRAGAATRAERAAALGEGARAAARRSPEALLAALLRRAADDSEVRPEWGLAGNHAFIAAPRALTRGLDLGGRAFLHDYDAGADADGRVLAQILTAPLVVASWINLQYYASTVAPTRWGSGDKTLHNVVGGGVGVLLGNGGDLRVGLPWQSVHDGRRFVHEPLRLTAFVAAPRDAIDRVIASHAGLRDLVANGWIHLHQVEPDGRRHWVRDTTGAWTPDDGATA